MNLFDIIIAAVLLFFSLKGLLRGFVNEAASLTALFVGGWLAYRYYPLLAAPLRAALHIPAYISAFIAFLLILLGIGILAHILGNVITAALSLAMLGAFNRAGGLLVGAAEGALLLCMIFSVGNAAYMPELLKKKIVSSERAKKIADTGDAILTMWRSRPSGQP
jgi:membrane protein required for colicin V production